jgi:hypothetical protein
VTFASIIGHGIILFYGAVVIGAILIIQGIDRLYFQVGARRPSVLNLPDSVPALIYVWIAMAVTAIVGVAYALAPALRSVK